MVYSTTGRTTAYAEYVYTALCVAEVLECQCAAGQKFNAPVLVAVVYHTVISRVGEGRNPATATATACVRSANHPLTSKE